MAGFNTAVTGLKAATTDLDVTGNNIANSSTVGFKASRTEFGDIYTTAVVGAGSSNVPGSGVTVTDIAQDFSGGTVEFTNNNLDLAINGGGFFQLDDGQGGKSYSRAGAFELDKDGFVVSKTGEYLQGYQLDEAGNRLPIDNLAVTERESPPKATEEMALAINIDSRADASQLLPAYNKDEPGSYTYSTTMEAVDSLGNSNTIKYNFVEQRPVKEVHTFDVSGAGNYTISGVTVADTDFAAGQISAVKLDELKAADPRIFNVTTDTTAAPNTVSVIFSSDSTQYGDLIASNGTAALTNEVVSEITAAEQHTFDFSAAGFGPGYAGATTVEFEISGVQFSFDASTADITAEDVANEIIAKRTAIIDANPNVDTISYDSTNNQLLVTYKPEAGDVADDNLDLVFLSGTNAFAGAPAAVTNVIGPDATVDGDDSFEGTYRMYAYLNQDTILTIGKQPDPGSGLNLPEVGAILIKYSPNDGTLAEINGQIVTPGSVVPSITVEGADPANGATTIDLSLDNSTQFASDSIVKQSTQDGYSKGDLVGISFGSTGEMIASFSNGQNQALGIVAIATFENQSGLQPAGDTQWVESLSSGQAIVNPPGTGLNGTLRSAALEQSNVDLSEQLVKLIEAQRNFQANSKTLETLNTVTQAILQI